MAASDPSDPAEADLFQGKDLETVAAAWSRFG
jgi:hypothetical protein